MTDCPSAFPRGSEQVEGGAESCSRLSSQHPTQRGLPTQANMRYFDHVAPGRSYTHSRARSPGPCRARVLLNLLPRGERASRPTAPVRNQPSCAVPTGAWGLSPSRATLSSHFAGIHGTGHSMVQHDLCGWHGPAVFWASRPTDDLLAWAFVLRAAGDVKAVTGLRCPA